MLLGMHADDDAKASMITDYERMAPRNSGHVSAGLAFVADTDAEAVATMRAALPRWLGPGLAGYRRADGAPHRTRDPHQYTELLCRLHPVGSPERCRQRLRRSRARTAIEHVVLMVEGAGDPARTAENIRRLGAEVLPGLREPAAQGVRSIQFRRRSGAARDARA